MNIPTLTELYLAFRQAKIALFFERRGVGLVELAKYENNLDLNLRRLRARLRSGRGWFDDIPIGEVYVVPKKLLPVESHDKEVLRIGSERLRTGPSNLEVQLRLTPSPDFAILEIIYLRQFGPALDLRLSSNVVGYRLDLKNNRLSSTRRWTFEYWRPRYQAFRTAPLDAAKKALESGDESVMIVSADLATFYDTIDPSFLVRHRFLAEIRKVVEQYRVDFNETNYLEATASLLRAYKRFRGLAASVTGLDWPTGIPIGALTSRLVSNVSLATVDDRIAKYDGLLAYRRYVDDMVIVVRSKKDDSDHLDEILGRFFPIKNQDDRIALDTRSLGRRGSDFEIKREKVRVHHLAGVPGDDFLRAVADDFRKLVSEQRAFLDTSLVGNVEPVAELMTAAPGDGSPLRVLRDADRVHLAHFALSTHLKSLERVSVLLSSQEAREVVGKTQRRLVRALGDQGDWVNNLELSLRLLRLALATHDRSTCDALMRQMDGVWKTVKILRRHVEQMHHRGRRISKLQAWTSLRDYMHTRRFQAAASAMTLYDGRDPCLADGITFRRKLLGLLDLQNTAILLAMADLRDRDREDDKIKMPSVVADDVWLRSFLARSPDLKTRLSLIGKFVARCRRLSDTAWQMPPARLFLCTRPPSYFDIARRWLYRVERDGFAPDVFESLLRIVNAVRGTDYHDPVGFVIDQSTVRINSGTPTELNVLRKSPPRLILANLPVSNACFDGAVKRVPGSSVGQPVLTWSRLRDLAETIEKARASSRGVANSKGLEGSLLVFPELSIPRRWLRQISNHTADSSNFGLIVGLEYHHDLRKPHVLNQAVAVLPGPLRSVATWAWTKRIPARVEEKALAASGSRLTFPPLPRKRIPRTVVQSPFGDFSVLICSEMLEPERISDLLNRVDLVVIPSWNKDTASYEHLIQAVGLQLHAFLGIANNGQYSDCRAWGPFKERWQRDLCRLIERHCNDVVAVELPITALRRSHAGVSVADDPVWLPLPPGFGRVTAR